MVFFMMCFRNEAAEDGNRPRTSGEEEHGLISMINPALAHHFHTRTKKSAGPDWSEPGAMKLARRSLKK
jgi:hypothetical protein